MNPRLTHTYADYEQLADPAQQVRWKELSYKDVLYLLVLERSQCPAFYWTLRQKARLTLLEGHSTPSLAQNPLQKGAVLCVMGRSIFSYPLLEERLLALGIAANEIITPETTHVLLGNIVHTTQGLEQYAVTFLNDQQLQAALDRLEQPYLLSKDRSTQEQVANLGKLLMTFQKETAVLALELIRAGGFPKQLIPQAFLAFKMTRSRGVYRALYEILQAYLSPEGREALAHSTRLRVHQREDQLCVDLAYYCKTAPELDAETLGKLLFCKYRMAIQFIWLYTTNSLLKKTILETFLEGNTLLLGDKGLSLLPKELADYKGIEKVYLQDNFFTRVFPILSQLPQLTHLNLANNHLRDLPNRLLKMTQLRELNISGSYQARLLTDTNLPKLTQLERLVVTRVGSGIYKETSITEEALQRALPHCEIIYQP